MPRAQQNAPESQPAAAPGDAQRKPTRDADVETLTPPASETAGSALFRALVAAGADAVAAYTVVRETESMAGQSVVAQLAPQFQAVVTKLDDLKKELAEVKGELKTLRENQGTLKTDVAVLKKEVRLIWLLLIPTLTAILIRLFIT